MAEELGYRGHDLGKLGSCDASYGGYGKEAKVKCPVKVGLGSGGQIKGLGKSKDADREYTRGGRILKVAEYSVPVDLHKVANAAN